MLGEIKIWMDPREIHFRIWGIKKRLTWGQCSVLSEISKLEQGNNGEFIFDKDSRRVIAYNMDCTPSYVSRVIKELVGKGILSKPEKRRMLTKFENKRIGTGVIEYTFISEEIMYRGEESFEVKSNKGEQEVEEDWAALGFYENTKQNG